MNNEEKLQRILGKKSKIVETREEYIQRKTGIDKEKIKRVLNEEEKYLIQSLKKTKKAKLLGIGIYTLKDNGKIKIKCPERLINNINKEQEIDIKEIELDMIVKDIE